VNGNNSQLCNNCGEFSEFIQMWLDVKVCGLCKGWEFSGDVSVDALELYDQDYFSGNEYLNYKQHLHIHVKNFRRKLNIIAKYLVKNPEHLVDVGCAYGYFLGVAKEYFPGIKAIGFDVHPDVIAEAVKFGNDCRVIDGTVPNQLEFEPDVVTLWDAFEHIPAAAETLAALSAWQKKGGILAVSTLDSGALVPGFRGRAWRQFHPPTHLHYPTRTSMEILFNRNGYKILHHQSFGYFRALEQYLPLLKLYLPRQIAVFPIYLNLFDIQLVIGIKR
jgi:SAM-dependent methyltransferase